MACRMEIMNTWGDWTK